MYMIRLLQILLLLTFTVLASACMSDANQSVDTNSGDPSANTSPRVYIFDCGAIVLEDVSSFGLSNDETQVRELFVPCYMVEHQGKRMLWDAGLPLTDVGARNRPDPGGYKVTYAKSLLEQLADMSLSPADFDYIALSHFHFDHAGAANAFADATLLIQQTEYEAAFVDYANNPVFNYSLYKDLAKAPVTKLQGNHDVFGDGAVQLIASPGHTPGHQVLLLELKNYGPVVLSGDLYHFEESRKLRRMPVFNTNAQDTLHSMDKVEALVKEHGATLWIEHVKAQADTLRKAPAYYD